MEETILSNKRFQFIISIITAISFTLFIAYQIQLTIRIEENRLGRLIGIALYLMITVAAFLSISERNGLWIAHAILLITGLVLLFAMRLLNVTVIFGYLDFAVPASVMNCAVYILTQLGTIVLVAGYLTLRAANLESREIRMLVTVLMSVAVVIFVSCFILESILLIKYHMNIDLSLTLTLISRFLFCLGYVGIAVSFILPAPKREKEKERQGEFYYADDEEKDIDLVI